MSRRRGPGFRRAFTLIEVMAAVVLLGLLTAAVALSFAGPIRRARAAEAVEQVRYLDASSRAYAKRFGRPVEMRFDLDEGRMERREGGRFGGDAKYSATVASPIRIEVLRRPNRREESGEVGVPVSPLGISPTYAVKLAAGPEGAPAQWVVVSGLSGEVRTLSNDAQVDAIFAALSRSRRDAD